MIIERRICDYCFTSDNQTHDATATRTIVIDKRAIEIDVCETVDEQLAALLAPFQKAGRRVATKARASSPPPPPPVDPTPTDEQYLCSCGRTFDTQRGLTRHTNHPPIDSDVTHSVAA